MIHGEKALTEAQKAYLDWANSEKGCTCINHHADRPVSGAGTWSMCNREQLWRRYCELRDGKRLGDYLFPVFGSVQ